MCCRYLLGFNFYEKLNDILETEGIKAPGRINSETANLNKTADASAKQLIAIDLIREKRGLDSLPEDLREMAMLRVEHPEFNLRELGSALPVPISRSGANHRIQRLMAIAEELKGK